jgi:hypothetical protein
MRFFPPGSKLNCFYSSTQKPTNEIKKTSRHRSKYKYSRLCVKVVCECNCIMLLSFIIYAKNRGLTLDRGRIKIPINVCVYNYIQINIYVVWELPSSPFILEGTTILGSSSDEVNDFGNATREYRLRFEYNQVLVFWGHHYHMYR